MYAASLALVLPLIAVEAHPTTQSPDELTYRSAGTLIYTGRYAEAETFLREAIASTIQSSFALPLSAERVFGGDSIWAISVKNSQSSLLIDTGRLAEAEAILRHAIAAGKKQYGADHAVVIGLMNRLGIVLQKSGKTLAPSSSSGGCWQLPGRPIWTAVSAELTTIRGPICGWAIGHGPAPDRRGHSHLGRSRAGR